MRAKADTRRRLLGVLVTLYVSSAPIGTLTTYRTVEYFATVAIPAPQTGEVYDIMSISPVIRFFYVFEVTLTWVNTMMWNLRHPGNYLPKAIATYLGEDGLKREECKFKDTRSIIVQILDPFDIWGLIKGKNKKDRWWERAEGVQVHEEQEAGAQGQRQARGWREEKMGYKRRIFLFRMIPHLLYLVIKVQSGKRVGPIDYHM